MKIKIILLLSIMIGSAAVFIYRGVDQKTVNRVSAQTGGGCNSYSSDTEDCGENENCGLGFYNVTAAYLTGSGLNGAEPRSASCQGTSCPSLQNVPTSYFNNYCCDQDLDGVSSTACGGNDCNDDPFNNGYNINPNAQEVCDGVDNNCNGQTDEGFDADGDGWTTCAGDCRDNDSDTYPGAPRWCGIMQGYWDKDCSGYDDELECIGSPIVVDVAGNGFNLTNPSNGVAFDLNSDSSREQLSWTSPNSDDAWLAVDRNGNGQIDNGQELFGNFSQQPLPPAGIEKNGFLALAEYDKPEKGGNSDQIISIDDEIFTSLRLWQDTNHNGISEIIELKTLDELGLAKLELRHKKSKRKDEYGNEFRYRAKVKDTRGNHIDRWAWDVFLKTAP